MSYCLYAIGQAVSILNSGNLHLFNNPGLVREVGNIRESLSVPQIKAAPHRTACLRPCYVGECAGAMLQYAAGQPGQLGVSLEQFVFAASG